MSSKDSIICPNCEAQITADAGQLIVYCMYCGAKIQMRDIVEVRHVQVAESLEKMVTDGETYLKVEEYYLAEKKFREVIKLYPKDLEGYEGLIRTLTKDGTVFPIMHETEIFRLLHEAELVAPEEERKTFAIRREKMLKAFEDEHEKVKQAQRDKEIDMEQYGREQRRIYSIIIIAMVFMIVFLMVLVGFVPPIEFSVFLVVFAGGIFLFIWRKNS